MTFRCYCRRCDAARDADGAWPGRCTTCRARVEEHPVPDVVQDDLRLLLVGINPGIMTARSRTHFGNPLNPFWAFLHESGLTPRRLAPEEQNELLRFGIGVTNIVTRATPGSSDVTREDVGRGRTRLAPLLESRRVSHLAFVGKQAFEMATGNRAKAHGVQPALGFARDAFVLPSTSPANASVSRPEKLRWFVALRTWVHEM